MKTPCFPAALPVLAGVLALGAAGVVQAQEAQARVVSSTPVIQQVAVPRHSPPCPKSLRVILPSMHATQSSTACRPSTPPKRRQLDSPAGVSTLQQPAA